MTPAQIKQIRKALNRNQAEMAQVIGIHPQTWHRWETGKSTPSARDQHTLERWYQTYCCQPMKDREVVR